MTQAARLLAVTVVFAAWLLPAQAAFATDSHPSPRPSASRSSESSSHQEDSEDEDSHDSGESEGKKFTQPVPGVVKPEPTKAPKPQTGSTTSGGTKTTKAGTGSSSQVTGTNATSTAPAGKEDFVTSSVTGSSSKQDKTVETGGVNPNQNQPVIESISQTSFDDPAQQFMGKAYFGLGALLAAAIAMAMHTYSKTRAAQRENEDFDLNT